MSNTTIVKSLVFINPIVFILILFGVTFYDPDYKSAYEINYYLSYATHICVIIMWFGWPVLAINFLDRHNPNPWATKLTISFYVLLISTIFTVLTPLLGLSVIQEGKTLLINEVVRWPMRLLMGGQLYIF